MKKYLSILLGVLIFAAGCGSSTTSEDTSKLVISSSLDGGVVVSSSADTKAVDINQTSITDVLATCTDENNSTYYYSGYFYNCTNNGTNEVCYNFNVTVNLDNMSCIISLINGTPITTDGEPLSEEEINNINATVVSVLPTPIAVSVRNKLQNQIRVRLRLKPQVGKMLLEDNLTLLISSDIEIECCNDTNCKLNDTDISNLTGKKLSEFITAFKVKLKTKLHEALNKIKEK